LPRSNAAVNHLRFFSSRGADGAGAGGAKTSSRGTSSGDFIINDDVDDVVEVDVDDSRELFGWDPTLDGLEGSSILDAAASATSSADAVDGGDDDDDVGALGPRDTWPPRYRRDAATGRLLVHEVRAEMSDEDRRVLRVAAEDPVERDRSTLRHLERHWARRRRQQQDKAGGDHEGGKDEQDEGDVIDDWGRRVRETRMSTNVLGRSVQSQLATEALDDGTALGRDESGFSQHLTPAEFRSFQAFLQHKHHLDLGSDDLPVQETSFPMASSSSSSSSFGANEADPAADDTRRSLQWLTQRAQRQMDDLADDDNPYAELMPGDLSPTPLVNRKRAKLLPRELLSHNNVELLQYFLSPTGQIKNRVQTRLGAKDQRKIARLVKRARALGLIPHVGQFKVEKHGWIHAENMPQDRPWEEELVRRGLVIQRKDGKKNARDNPGLESSPSQFSSSSPPSR
jgi:small subunit ribosomal protein S18